MTAMRVDIAAGDGMTVAASKGRAQVPSLVQLVSGNVAWNLLMTPELAIAQAASRRSPRAPLPEPTVLFDPLEPATTAMLGADQVRWLIDTLAASTGASTKELMSRLGHSSPRAALIYQHATADRDAAIAGALSDLILKQRQQSTSSADELTAS